MGNLGLEKTAEMICNGKGPLGTCSEYLLNTVAQLAEIGVRDSYLNRLLDYIKQKGGPAG